MSTAAASGKTSPSVGDVLRRLQRQLSGRRGLIILALTVTGAGVALNWTWLTAIGVAPILLAVAPCAAMCALGLCMNKMGGKSCSNESAQADPRKAGNPTNARS